MIITLSIFEFFWGMVILYVAIRTYQVWAAAEGEEGGVEGLWWWWWWWSYGGRKDGLSWLYSPPETVQKKEAMRVKIIITTITTTFQRERERYNQLLDLQLAKRHIPPSSPLYLRLFLVPSDCGSLEGIHPSLVCFGGDLIPLRFQGRGQLVGQVTEVFQLAWQGKVVCVVNA